MRLLGVESLDNRDMMAANILSAPLEPQSAEIKYFSITLTQLRVVDAVDGNAYYLGTANGGVWKTTNGGRS